MKVLQINAVYPTGSTGKICKGIFNKCLDYSIDCFVAYACGNTTFKEGIAINTFFGNRVANRLSRITMLEGHFSFFSTICFIKKIKRLKPDIIHIHNIHENFINLKPLFKYIKKNRIKTIFTAHDCWFFTGYCKYFSLIRCEKWKTKCGCCPQKGLDKVNLFDNSKHMFNLKKEMFCGIDNLTIVSPSNWLNELLKQSFLKDKHLMVINNGIDLTVFTPTESNFRKKNNIKNDDFVVLGVAAVWEQRKGLDSFLELSKRLPNNYKIVLVGTDDKVDKILPKRVISIHRTQNQKELVEIYSSADIFVNPTKEENYPTVNMESLACGTPVLTFDTGGSSEIIDETCGSVVECGDIEKLEKEVIRICSLKPFSIENCLIRAEHFDEKLRYEEYIKLYKELNENG